MVGRVRERRNDSKGGRERGGMIVREGGREEE